jgi:hypothetical protein
MYKKVLIFTLVACTFISIFAQAQSVFAPLNQDYEHLVDRYEIKRGKFSEGFHTSVKPYTRKGIIQLVDSVWADPSISLSEKDKFNLSYLENDSWEWTKKDDIGNSKNPLWNIFYRKKADAYSNSDDILDLHVSPIVDVEFGSVSDGVQNKTSLNTRGVEIRGMINRKVGFYSFISENQAYIPEYVKRFVDSYNQNEFRLASLRLPGMPGEGLTKEFKQDAYATDFFAARAYITFQATKNIQIQFGHDKNFIGNGFRSMILSDNSAPSLFLKINTHIGKFQYQNLFTQLVYTGLKPNDQIFPKKYMSMHHLSINVSKHLNLGISESIIFQRDSTNGGAFDLNYLNPVIFYRSIESFQGSGDNAFIGLDFKWNFAKRFSVYGQLMLDEFIAKEIFKSTGYWANKYGMQGGIKYIDVFGISNLDFQTEINSARPYTYSHYDGSNYTQYNQALAHPLGANFIELSNIIRWQPIKNLNIIASIIYAKFGEDRTPTENWGQNIEKSYDTRSRKILYKDDYGNTIGQGRNTSTMIYDVRASYQLKHNFFLDLHFLNRNYQSIDTKLNYITTIKSFGIRWNIPYRQMLF